MRRLLASAVIVVLVASIAMAPAWATFPGGNGRIAFVRGGNIWVMKPDGSGQTRLTSGGTAGNPQWSADGRRIAYDRRSADGNRDVWVMNADGTRKVRVTTHLADDADPAWSPDGRWLAFVSDRRGRGEIFTLGSTVPFGRAIRLTSTAGTGEPEATPEDPRIADAQPSWSPSGERIAFRRYFREYDISYWGYTYLLMTMDVDGTDLVAGDTGGYGVTCPTWGPGGTKVGWVDDEWWFNDGSMSSNVRHSNPDGTSRVAVTAFTEDPAWRVECLSWSPNRGTRIVFAAVIDDGSTVPAPRLALYRIASGGAGTPTLIATNAAMPDWGPAL